MRISWRAGVSFSIAWALAVGHVAAGAPRSYSPDKKEKPLLIVAVLIGLLEPSCQPGQPVAFLKVRVSNKSRVSTPALPASDGVEAQDDSTPPWRGAAALPALHPGQVIEVSIPLQPPANLLPGKHTFQVTVNPRHVIEQEHYKFNSAGPLVVDIPAGLCRTASVRPEVENLPPASPPAGRSPNVPARPQQQSGPWRDTPRRSNTTADPSAYTKAAAVRPQQEWSPKSLARFGTLAQSPAPTYLGSPFTGFECNNHLGPQVCQTSGIMFCQAGDYLDCPTPPWGAWTDPAQHLMLMWNWDSQQKMDGFHLYRVDMDRHDLLMTVSFFNRGTVFDCGVSSGCDQMCFAVTAFQGKLDSPPSNPFCAPNAQLQKGMPQRRNP